MTGNFDILIFSTVLLNLAFLLFGYLIGSLNTSIIFGKFKNKDVRDSFSGNAGATNTSRVFGVKIGVLILIIDAFKTIMVVYLATGIAYWVNQVPQIHGKLYSFQQYQPMIAIPLLAGLGVIIGHCFPVFFGFKGGKGVACTIGFIISYNIVLLPIAAVFFFAMIFWKKYVSLAGIVTAVLLIPFVFIPWMSNSVVAFPANFYWLNWTKDWNVRQNFIPSDQLGYVKYISTTVLNVAPECMGIIYVAAAGVLISMHKDNIKRLIKGEERKFSTKK
ncbi:glycerol-3-phosphate 1-O-acyltransferase PlsY [Mycoplasma seminis]|uniref:Glycerol-3-phosphate acyltransferase n=1 Tax=Mycoplasma seminis TaxID=512749 RepID=A0ABY9HAF4_9MOLU|nr:glycerol-3-phosphate 1-O-acyltransferase PlsY [Mycoplasma seminis]WLP85580.1 glycerol-3-phosphate 1-O-acyltransferase PlsY [Mycoplasma seminis]